MAREISLFSGYSQKENRTTNYCLLVLKMMYEENPKFLGEVLSNLVDASLGDLVGVRFQQQQKRKSSVPDGLIFQRPFAIYIETKNFDWFYDEQLANHLEALHADGPGAKVLLALGKFEALTDDRFEQIRRLCATTYQDIYFGAVSFEDLLGAVRDAPTTSKNLSDAIADFEAYLDEQGLLPRWKTRLDVVNCSGRPREVIEGGTYLCPATGGAYNHKRSKFFGAYSQKAVRHVALIEAVVDVEGPDQATLKWSNVKRPASELLDLARERHQQWRAGQYPIRVFLLGDRHKTHFEKESKGGMQTSKRYFDVGDHKPENAADLAKKLSQKKWE